MLRRLGRQFGINKLITTSTKWGNYEKKFSDLMLKSIKQGDCIWDVGANIGLYSTKFAERVGEQGCVICFEPSPTNTVKLQNATRGIGNLTIQQLALGATTGQIGFVQGLDELGATSRVLDNDELPRDDVILVSVVRGDDLVASNVITSPTVLKIDTEGYEFDVLCGLQATLKLRTLRAVFIEIHFSLLEDRGLFHVPRKIESLLIDSGFQCSWADASHIAGVRVVK